eukprot:gb/GECG01010982.1/.p1 GENE.gb/GECG01010982.1/~~gb/GECG01010982.1/.p1  ORF type:complete len:457 (+),score=65.50 gb/GECG01010982.1/:1-1371(+)
MGDDTMGGEDPRGRHSFPPLQVLLQRYGKQIAYGIGALAILCVLIVYGGSKSSSGSRKISTDELCKGSCAQKKPLRGVNNIDLVSDFAQVSSGPKDLRIDPAWLLSVGINAAKAAGEKVVSIQTSGELGQSSKGEISTTEKAKVDDPLTEADVASHQVMSKTLQSLVPGINVVSEEKDPSKSSISEESIIKAVDSVLGASKNTIGLEEIKRAISSKALLKAQDVVVWLDPLDATKEYTEGLTQYVTVMVGIALKGTPIGGIIHYPFTGETLWGWTSGTEGVRFDSSQALWDGNSEALHETVKVPPEKATVDSSSDIGETVLRVILSRSHAGGIREHLAPLSQTFKDITATPAGGAGFKIGEVLADRQDVYVHTSGIKKWDLCAGDALLRAQRNKDRAQKGVIKTYSLLNVGGIRTWQNEQLSYGLDDPLRVGGLYGARSVRVDKKLMYELPKISLE